jgi:hypothetical protein
MRQIGNVSYYNCGDWVESCSAIVEHHDGRLELLNNLHPQGLITAPTVRISLLGVSRRF